MTHANGSNIYYRREGRADLGAEWDIAIFTESPI
jgi:hypothetical protein